MTKRTITGQAPKKPKKRTRQKQAKPGKSAVVAMRPTPEQVRAAEAEAFEERKRRQIVLDAYELDDVDKRILEYKLRHPAMSQEELGDAIGLNRNTIGIRLNAPKMKRALAVAHEAAMKIYTDGQAAAARKLRELIHDADSRVAIRACIAHLWPMIHRDKDDSTASDFATFIAEAYEASAAASRDSAAPLDPVRSAVEAAAVDSKGHV